MTTAVACFEQATRLSPDDFEVHLNFATALGEQGRPGRGIAECRRALELNPLGAAAHNNLGTLLQVLGQIDEAIASYRQAIELNPRDLVRTATCCSHPISSPEGDPRSVFAEHCQWGHRHADPLTARSLPHANDRTLNRRLRVGYVSPHFFAHAVNSFVEPILASHDRAACEVFCYSDVVDEGRDNRAAARKCGSLAQTSSVKATHKWPSW